MYGTHDGEIYTETSIIVVGPGGTDIRKRNPSLPTRVVSRQQCYKCPWLSLLEGVVSGIVVRHRSQDPYPVRVCISIIIGQQTL
jgi:hypothetical protein